MTKYDIVTIGDCNLDFFVVPHGTMVKNDRGFISGKSVEFELGEKILLDSADIFMGGTAGNTAVAFSRLGLKTGIISAFGYDLMAEKLLEGLKLENVDLKLIDQRRDIKSNFSIIFNFGFDRTIFVYHGLDDYSKLKIPKDISSKWVFVSNVGHGGDAMFSRIVAMASEKNLKIAWNPGSKQIEKGASHYESMLKLTTILSLNREEAIKFTNFPVRPDIKELAKRLHRLGAEVILITDGNNGAYCYALDKLRFIDILPAKKVDATGAVDSFTSAFVSQLIDVEIYDQTIETALKYAIVESTSVITKVGAQTGLLTASQIETEMEKHPRLRAEVL